MFSFRSIIRLYYLLFALGLAVRLSAQAVTLQDWGDADMKTPGSHKKISGASFKPSIAAFTGSADLTTKWKLEVSSDTGSYHDIKESGPGQNFGIYAGDISTAETGNQDVVYTATAMKTMNGSLTTVTRSVKLRIYVPEANPPSVPGNLSVTGLGLNQFTLNWNTSTDDQKIEFYEISSNGSLIATVPAGNYPSTYSFTYTGLAQGTTYAMTVRAKDWADNYSAWSSAFNVTTAVPDLTPPSQPGTPFFSNISNYGATVTWGPATDNVGVTSYSVQLLQGGINGTPIGSAYSTTVSALNLPNLASGTTYGVSIVAKDAAGNASAARQNSFTTLVATAPGPLSVTQVKDTSFSILWYAYVIYPSTDHYEVSINGGAWIPAGDSGTSAKLGYTFSSLAANTSYTALVRAVSTTGTASNASDPLTVITDAAPVSLSAVTRVTGSGNVVGTLPGGLSVDNHGSANYSIPLQIAPGRGGMQPSLSLNYSSGAGNGIAGVGFSLSTGFAQSITRGRSILARDGETRGVEFSSKDKFYLDGKRLICTSEPAILYGMPNSTYRTEVDSFVTITTTGSGSNIETFTVTDKSGTKSTFGTADSYQKGGAELNGLAYTYALKRVEDALGNFVSFTYTPLGGGEYVLAQIDYTGGPTVAAGAQVVLTYESRPDQPITYLSNRIFNHRARLALVTAKSGTTTTAVYNLNYTNDANGGRSRLTSVAPLLADPQSNALQTCPPLVIAWQNFASTKAGTAPTMPGLDVAWGDTNLDGVDEPLLASDRQQGGTPSFSNKFGDFDGDGKKDKLTIFYSNGSMSNFSFTLASGASRTFSTAGLNAFWSYFVDPGSQNGTSQLLQAEGTGIASRITVADFNGDGRDDVLVQGFDGKIHVFFATDTGFSDPINDSAHAPFVGGRGDVHWEVDIMSGFFLQGQTRIREHYYVKPMPCDLNGDGLTDYVCITYQRILKYPASPFQTAPTGFLTIRNMSGVISKPDGTFSSSFSIGGPAMMVPTETNDSASNNGVGSIKFSDINCGAMAGDFNGDGLTDFLVLVPEFEMQANIYSGYYQGKRWALYLNQGLSSFGTPVFAEYKGPIPNTVTLPGGEATNSYYTPIISGSSAGSIGGAVQYITTPSYTGKAFLAGLESAAGSTNNLIMDVNHDGMADLVWYAAVTTAEGPATGKGWYAMISTGSFADGSGFIGPVPVSFLSTTPGGVPSIPGNAFTATSITSGFDFNGDGFPDYNIQSTSNGAPYDAGTIVSLNPEAPQFCDLVATITDGLGRKTDIAYKAAKDSSVYTKGATVAFPIRELMASNPVVSDIWHDSGNDIATDRAQFSYEYSGNRLDLSGRGGLGFHSFITLDRQTNLFKYQFLTQSFPMTGLTHREETYRWLSSNNFNILSSHDNTVVFDKVMNGPTSYGTVWPYISKAVESRWEDGAGNFTTAGSNISSDAENIFRKAKPDGAHITITAQSKFDGLNDVQLTLPTTVANAAGNSYNPSDTNLSGQNTVVGTTSFAIFSGLPGNITYGNLTELFTDYDPTNTASPGKFTETVVTTYKPPVGSLTGLVNTVTTTVKGGDYTDSAPTKSYTYFGSTPLVGTETVTAGGNLTTKTTYDRDALGRVTSTTIDGTDLQSVGQGAVSYVVSSGTDFDSHDLPTITQNNYGHTTTVAYHSFLAKPSSVTDVNSAQVTTTYDALGRAIQVNDVLKGLTTNTAFAWDTTQAVAVPSGIVGLPGVALTSVYKVTTTATVAPTVTAYYDRLGRVIRTIKDGFGGQQILTDNVYNKLGQTVATSLPYLTGGTRLWTMTTYDPLGRIVTVTAPNGTLTTNIYKGRATSVSVDAGNLGGIDPGAQINSTVVDAKGRTVSVWNADNVPTFNDTLGATGTAPSISFTLDGFGRMRSTKLKDQSQTISAGYDSLGRQTQLADPDKGTWNYLNSALGHVLTQTDANNNSTASTFDRLGRPLSRTTTRTTPAYNETANFYYYDTAFNSANHTVVQGNQGWIGAPEREECVATGSYPTTNLHYYDAKGRPAIELAQTDGKWFYTYSDYDAYSRPRQVRHYWKPSGYEAPGYAAPGDKPYLWQDFGYTYQYDGTGTTSKSYLISLTDSLGRSWWDTPAYDYMDRVTSVRKGNGLTTTRNYRDVDGVLTGITTGSIQSLGFNFDGLGNLTQRTDTNATGGTENLTYDNLNRLQTSKQGTTAYEANGNIRTKPDVAGTVSATYDYGSSRPHAVTGAFGYTIAYDGNGNIVSRLKANDNTYVQWCGFDKPRWLYRTTLAGTVGSEFHYNAARSRVMQLEFDQVSGGNPSRYVRKRTYAMGSTLELNYDTAAPALNPTWNLKKIRIYVPGPDGLIGAREFDVTSGTAGTEKSLVYHYDHLGSITATTDFGATTIANDTGGKPGKFSEDAWGQRRSPISWSGAPDPAVTDDGHADSVTPRGFTGHEMLDDLGLVHMNGRIYDPLLGRFLSADLIVQAPENLQSYNRYSYVFNNPISYTDPSGFATISDYEKEIAKAQEKIRALVELAKNKKISPGELLFRAGNAGAVINRDKNAIADIQKTAAALSEISGVGIDARKIDDIDPDYKSNRATLNGLGFVPGSSAAKEFVKGDKAQAAINFGEEVALTLIGGKLVKWLNGSSAEVASKIVTEAAEDVAAKSAGNPAGKLTYSAANKSWTSPGGLIYGEGSLEGNRVLHVLEHTAPNTEKAVHSVFTVARNEIIALVDEAWAAKSGTGILQANGNRTWIVDLGRQVGTGGQTAVQIIVRDGTTEVISAYPK